MSTDQQSLPDRLRAHAAAVAWQDRAEIGEDLVAAAGEIERLTLLNEDKFRHLQAYCKAADEDRATIARLARERDAYLSLLTPEIPSGESESGSLWYAATGRFDPFVFSGHRFRTLELDGPWDDQDQALSVVNRTAGLDPEPASERSEA